jgi:hypothetical protein
VRTIPEALADIESTQDLLERAMKLSGLVTAVFDEFRRFKLEVTDEIGL